MFILRKILSICVISVICARNLFAHQIPIIPFQNNVAATYDNYIRDTVKFTYPIQTIYKDQNDNYIAVLADGTELDVTQRLSNAGHTLIEDSEGNQMAVTGDHRLMSAEQYHKTGKNNTLIKSDNERKDKQIAASGDVVFMPSGNQQYGFDAYDASTNNHPEIYPPLEGGSYRPAYKSVAQWQQDKVTADPIDGVTFRTQMGVPYAKANGEILLRGEPLAGETPVYAHVAETDSTTKVVGKLNLLTFEPREINVCLVPVNGASLPNIQTLEKELNKIFKPAVASVKLSTATPINIQYANGENFVHGGSGLLSVYSEDEKNAIKALQNADNDTYYLFVVDNVTRLNPDGTAMKDILAGYMPIGYQCGFLFGSPAAKYVAHELGHGAFGLHHTFSSETESFSAPQYSTDNLMDYAEGATLNHKQWTWMHEKHGAGLFRFLVNESEGEGVIDALRTKYNWAIIPYAKRISESFARMLIERYDLLYDINCSYGQIQNDLSSVSHNYTLEEALSQFENIDTKGYCKLEFLSKKSEDDVKSIFENGMSFCGNKGVIGLKTVLSENLFKETVRAFYNKNLSTDYVLSFNSDSDISQNLHINTRFQNDYYINKVIKYIYSNLTDETNLKLLAQEAKCPDFSNKYDIPTYDYYGLMGGTQRVEFNYKIYNRNNYYLVDLNLIIQDWFGSDIDDICGGNAIKSNMSCLNAFFWLQHHFGCSPFKTEIKFKDYILITKQ